MLDLVTQIYIVSAGIGTLYLVAGLAMGQLHGHADSGIGHGDTGLGHDAAIGHGHGDAGIGHDAAIGHGHGDAGVGHDAAIGHGHGDAGVGHDAAIGHGHGDADVGHDAAIGHGHGDASGGTEPGQSGTPSGHALAPGVKHLDASPHIDIASSGMHHVVPAHHTSEAGPVQIIERRRFKPLRFLLTILSPMTIAVFLAFFGISGLLLAKLLPFLGPLTVPPAIIISLLITGQVLSLLRWMMFKMNVSSVVRVNELIGHPAEVLIPIQKGRVGEVTYVSGSTRLQAPAKPARPDMEFKRGAKVMISDIKDGVVYVEPWDDILLDNSTVFEVKEKLPER
ncbi:MAG TPA: hypothetical protein V6D08_01100 [Candidatus Obscuribacterales bacterium]